jgi:hypothetical protein
MNLRKILGGCACLFFCLFADVGGYVLSVIWRVSLAEHYLLGRSTLIKVFPNPQKYDRRPVIQSFNEPTYERDIEGLKVTIWHDKINGFQHAYGSALAAYDLNDALAEKLFCANEYTEWLFDKNGISYKDLLDRRRDLANNKIGRSIGLRARAEHLSRPQADHYMQLQVIAAMEFDHSIVVHPCEKKSLDLPSEAALGCAHLPRHNLTDGAARINRKIGRLERRIQRRLFALVQKDERQEGVYAS